MRDLAVTFIRGLTIVTLVAWNTRHVAALDYRAAFLTGGLLSVVWWGNAQSAGTLSAPGARWAYGLGAAVGTVCGMWLGR